MAERRPPAVRGAAKRPPDKKRALPRPAVEALEPYRRKRDFERTPEPSGNGHAQGGGAYVIQKHDASRLHYDLRLELDGIMLSWAVPKGPSFDPADKRMAIHVEDHPIAYNRFEGTIPEGLYGAGTVIVWDRGRWAPLGDARQGLADGKLVFDLDGHKLHGRWELVRIGKPGERQEPWLLLKKRDAWARPRSDYDVVRALPDSIVARPLRDEQAIATTAAPAASAVQQPSPRKAALPASLAPQLATPAEVDASELRSGDWLLEIKFDGYRLLARIDEGGTPKLFTRAGHDWTPRMPALAQALRRLGLRACWLDGEIIVPGADGKPDFNALQNAFDSARTQAIVYYLFDLPFESGFDLRALPLRERRARLEKLLQANSHDALRLSGSFDGTPHAVLQSACRLGLEGIVAKRADAPYDSRRSASWLKLKCSLRQEFIVVGFTDRGGERGAAEIGSLLLALHGDDGALQPVGSVGTGWNAATAAALKRRLLMIETAQSPLPAATGAAPRPRWGRRNAGLERWVQPQLVVEIGFAGWTPDAQLRHAKFIALRDDKPAAEVRREQPLHDPATRSRTMPAIKVSHPERVIDASTGTTKLDLVRFYESIAPWLLPQLRGRPCSLVRAPAGIGGEVFYQKHPESLKFAGLKALDAKLEPEQAPLIELGSEAAIAMAAQMNTVEFHTWNARGRNIDRPDRFILDLDPGDGVPWPRVQEAAVLVHTLLDELGLRAWLKTSGGKGLHVVVPLAARHGWDAVKDFTQALVQHLARLMPDRFVDKSGPANRVGKIYVDYLRNSQGATTVAAYSARARPGLGVSMPVAWDALDSVKSAAQWNIANARDHLSFVTDDPWAGMAQCRQGLTKAMKTLGVAGTSK